MIAHPDNDPGFDPDDPLTVLLRPAPEYAGPPDGRYRAVRRRAARRRLLRTAAGVGVTCAVAAVIVLPLHLTSDHAPGSPASPASPAAPLAPPPASSTPAVSTAPASPEAVTPRPTPTPTATSGVLP